jgi:hypothetical protein
MRQQNAEHHTKAAEHHEHAARHHREAAKHYASGNHEKAAHHAHVAHGHHLHAIHYAEESAKHHAAEYGVKIIPEGTFAGTIDKPVLVKKGKPVPGDTGDQGRGQN